MFIDSFKMKSSVILGVTQMCFGLVLSFLNHKYFGDEVSLIWEWIPQGISRQYIIQKLYRNFYLLKDVKL